MIYIAKLLGRAMCAIIVLGLLIALSQSHSNAGVIPRHSIRIGSPLAAV